MPNAKTNHQPQRHENNEQLALFVYPGDPPPLTDDAAKQATEATYRVLATIKAAERYASTPGRRS